MSADVETKLGYIKSVKVGRGGYQDAMFGITFELGGQGWGVIDFWGEWDPSVIKRDEWSQWTEDDRSAKFVDMVRRISKLLSDASVDDVAALKGKPVSVTVNGTGYGSLSSWRILIEVLP